MLISYRYDHARGPRGAGPDGRGLRSSRPGGGAASTLDNTNMNKHISKTYHNIQQHVKIISQMQGRAAPRFRRRLWPRRHRRRRLDFGRALERGGMKKALDSSCMLLPTRVLPWNIQSLGCLSLSLSFSLSLFGRALERGGV